jgi:ATP synthase subunit 6
MKSPLEQFKIVPTEIIESIIEKIVGEGRGIYDIRVNNSTIYTGIGIIIIGMIMKEGREKKIIRKERKGIIIMKGYEIVEGMLKEMMEKEYKKYVPIIGGIFMFIGINNIMGLIPYSFTITSHIIITMTMSLTIIIGVTIIGIKKHKGKFIKLFIPSGLNEGGIKYIIPFIFIIELVSYVIRIISLSVRMTANIMSGHTLLKIVSSFSETGIKGVIGKKITVWKIVPGIIGVIIPLIIISGIYLLEIGVAIIQSYVFTLLTTTYIKDSELLH